MLLSWFGPLVTLGFLVGFLISTVLLRLGMLERRAAWLAALALPFGCATAPIVLLALASLITGVLGHEVLAASR